MAFGLPTQTLGPSASSIIEEFEELIEYALSSGQPIHVVAKPNATVKLRFQ